MQQYIHWEGPDTLERRDKLLHTQGHWPSVKSRERLAGGDRGDTHSTGRAIIASPLNFVRCDHSTELQ